MSLIPATILTGFLGSGKTTLLNRILHEEHGQRIAVIENEFGEENIDNEILVQETREQIVEMNNGCICCTVRGDLVTALSQLAQKRRDGELTFDRVVIETTGLANPGPVAQTFFMDDEILDIRGFNLNDKLEIDPDFLKSEEDHHCDDHCDHDHHHHEHDHSGHHAGDHTDGIAAFVFRRDRAFDPARLEDVIGQLIQVYGPRMLRYKGILWMEGASRKVIFQGVHQTMGSDLGSPWSADEVRGSKIVFIGQSLPRPIFIEGLQQCLV